MYLCAQINWIIRKMTYTDFSNTFLLELTRSYRSGAIPFHGLIDFNLWRRICPDTDCRPNVFSWNKISFNAFTLNDSQKSLLIIYNIPIMYKKNEAEFVGIRFDNNRKQVLYYTLRRPRYNDEAWDIYLYDFDNNSDVILEKIQGTDSLREFKNAIERIPFRDKPTLFERIKTRIQTL